MASVDVSRQDAIRRKDEGLLAALGYKQEFKRTFASLEVACSKHAIQIAPSDLPLIGLGIAFSIIGLLPSIASVIFYAIPNGGGAAMVWV